MPVRFMALTRRSRSQYAGSSGGVLPAGVMMAGPAGLLRSIRAPMGPPSCSISLRKLSGKKCAWMSMPRGGVTGEDCTIARQQARPERPSPEVAVKLPHERFDYSPIVQRRPWRLPRGARIAVWTIVNVEEWNIEKAMPRQYLATPQGVAVVPDVPNWAWHEYGMRVGFWRILEALQKRKIKATTAINAHVCEAYPAV